MAPCQKPPPLLLLCYHHRQNSFGPCPFSCYPPPLQSTAHTVILVILLLPRLLQLVLLFLGDAPTVLSTTISLSCFLPLLDPTTPQTPLLAPFSDHPASSPLLLLLPPPQSPSLFSSPPFITSSPLLRHLLLLLAPPVKNHHHHHHHHYCRRASTCSETLGPLSLPSSPLPPLPYATTTTTVQLPLSSCQDSGRCSCPCPSSPSAPAPPTPSLSPSAPTTTVYSLRHNYYHHLSSYCSFVQISILFSFTHYSNSKLIS